MKVKVLNTQTQLEIREMILSDSIDQRGECLLGRSPHSNLILDSPDVSRLHGKFAIEQGDYYFYDLGSSNGSLINGQEAQPNQRYCLSAGDTIRVGEFLLMVYPLNEQPDLPATLIGDPNVTVIGRPRLEDSIGHKAATVAENRNEQPILLSRGQLSTSTEQISLIQEDENQESENQEIAVSDELLEHVESECDFNPLYQESAFSEDLTAQSDTISIQEATERAIEISAVSDERFAATADSSTKIQLEEASDSPNSAVESTSSSRIDHISQLEDSATPDFRSDDNSSSSPQSNGMLISASGADLQDSISSQTDSSQADAAGDEAQFEVISSAVTIPEITPAEEDEFKHLQAASSSTDQPDILAEGVSPNTEFAISETQPKTTDLDKTPSAPIVNPPEFDEEVEPQPERSVTTAESIFVSFPPSVNSSEVSILPLLAELQLATEPTVAKLSSTDVITDAEQAVEVNNQEWETVVSDPYEVEEQSHTVDPPTQPTEDANDAVLTTGGSNSKETEANQKCLALLAHDSQIPILVKFVTDHRDLLSRCFVITTPSINMLLKQQIGFETNYQTSATPPGGYQTINSWIVADKISAVIFLRDFITPQATQINDEAFSRACNIRQILFASNLSTADALLHYLQSQISA